MTVHMSEFKTPVQMTIDSSAIFIMKEERTLLENFGIDARRYAILIKRAFVWMFIEVFFFF